MRRLKLQRILAMCLTVALLFSALMQPARAEADVKADTVENAPEAAGSEQYRTQFTTDLWQASSGAGSLLRNDTGGVCLDIAGRGAGLAATMLDYEGQTPCNALQIVLENRSACTDARIWVEYRSGDSASCTVTLQPQSPRTVYYAYLGRVDDIRQVSVTFNAVSDGEITLYSFSRVSFYQQMSQADIYGAVSDCYYDEQGGNVIISGQLHSDAVVDFFGGSISLYPLGLQEEWNDNAWEGTEPIASIRIANRFTFTVPAPTLSERGCLYAVVLTDTTGKRFLMCEPCFPASVSERTAPNAYTAYKGIQPENVEDAMRCYADATMVDVYLDELMAAKEGETLSYAYDGVYYSYNRAYALSLEQQILPLLQVGCEVYLRLLIRANDAGYALPFTCDQPPVTEQLAYLAVYLDDLEAQRAYAAALSYLLTTLKVGGRQPLGLILGREMDNSLQFNYAGMLPLCDYLDVIVNAVLQSEAILYQYCPQATLYLPVSDTAYSAYYTSYDLDGVYATSMLLDGVCRMLDDRGNGAFDISILLEMTRAPYDLTRSITDQGSSAVIHAMNSHKSTDGLDNKPTVSSIASDLTEYDCLRAAHSVLWMPPEDCTELAWELSYIYLYYVLRDGSVRTFFTHLSTADVSDKTELLAKIDTSSVSGVVSFAPPYFDMSSVNDLFELSARDIDKNAMLYTAKLIADTRAIYTGRYQYWNFTAAIGTLQWGASYGCTALSADGGSRYGRSLLAQMQPGGGEVLYSFAKTENFAVCDALSVTLAVTDQNGDPVNADVQMTLYGKNERIEATGTVKGGDATTLTLTGLPLQAATDCRAISIRAVDEEPEREGELRVYILYIEGLSRLLDDQALQTEILAQRQHKDEAQSGNGELSAYPVLLLTMLTMLTTVGILLSLRASRKRRSRHKSNI